MSTDRLRVGLAAMNSRLSSALAGILLEQAADGVEIDHVFVVRRHIRALHAIFTSRHARKCARNSILSRFLLPNMRSGIPTGFSDFERRHGTERISHWTNYFREFTRRNRKKVTYLGTPPSQNTDLLRKHKLDVLCYLGGEVGLMKKPLFDSVNMGVVAAHGGAFLPTYRGMSIVEWSLMNGDALGTNTFFADEGVDTGPVLLQKPLDLDGATSLEDVYAETLRENMILLADTLRQLQAGTLTPTPQKAEDGHQYFYMHPRLAVLAMKKREAARASES